MKICGIFLTVLLLSGSISLVFAHPDPIGVSIQNQNGVILYENQLGSSVKNEEPTELFSTEWFYQNFILILVNIIIAIMIVVCTLVYKENIQSTTVR